MFKKFTNGCVRVVNRWLPDAFLFAIILTLVVFVGAMCATGMGPIDIIAKWGDQKGGFWNLLAFSMQMALVLVFGSAMASAKPCKKALRTVAGLCHNEKQAILVTTFVSTICCWLNWGFGLVIGALLAKEVVRRVPSVDYPLLIASAYSGFVIWHAGLSGSIPLDLVAGKAFGEVTYQAPITATVFHPMNLIMCGVILVLMPFVNYAMHPHKEHTVTVNPALLVDEAEKEYPLDTPAEKLEQLRAKLKELGCTAQLVGKLDNLAWLLNLRAMDIQCTPYAMAYCYVTVDRAVLFINTRRLGAEAAAELKENGVEIAEYDDILTFLAAETEAQTVLADPASVNYAVYETLCNNPVLTVKDEADPLLPMKGVKNETELNHNREAHLRDAVAMVRFQKELEERLAAGEELTELTVDEILHKYRSAQDKFIVESFGTIAAYGGNAAMMHYHATPEDHAVLQRKGFLLVDSGATYLDGTTDITRTYPLGELTEDERLFYTWTLQCHIDIAKAVWLDYCDCHMLDTIAREPLWRHLINYRCGTGHSVSFVGNVHEGPHALNGRNTVVFQPGMIVTDEPGVYESGVVGIRIENELECYHKADNQYGTFLAFRPLTFVPIATSPIVPGVLDKEQVAWLNDYHRKVFEQLAPRLTEDERAWLAEKCAAIGC